jgi:transcriptional regulator with XRE-family HTH domain
MDAQRQVGLNARKHRLAARLTQEDVADRMGVDRSFVSGLERGERNLTLKSLASLARALGVKLVQLVEGL